MTLTKGGMRDKLDRADALLIALRLVVDTADFKSYFCQPHTHLLELISELICEVEEGLSSEN